MIDIDRNTQNANLGSFAGDKRIWRSLNTIHSLQHLQTALDQICIWAEDNNMLFNGDKFEFLNFGRSVRGLGINFEPNGEFDKHVQV